MRCTWGTGTATQTPSYTDAAGTNAGNTVSRATKTTGLIATGFTLSGGGKLCVEETGSGAKVDVDTCSTSAAAQKWAIGTDGTVKAGGFCLDTAGNATASGTGVVADTCSTDATQKWRVTSTGTLVNAAKATLCLTDPSASATKGTQLTLTTCGGKGQTWSTITSGALPVGQTQTFTYDAEGRTATVSTPSGTMARTSKYLYDADGNLLEQTASAGGTDKTRILYLFGGAEQLTLDVTAKTCTALRYYSGPDGTRVTRSSSGDVWYQVANSQGTATTSVAADDLAVTRRYYDPYGNPRGSKPSGWVSADENHGFLGKPADSVTGLDLLGARNYDPALGRFVTPDPLFQAGDPNQMGGYTYAADNPASSSDPTGFDDWYNYPGQNPCVIDCNTPTPSPSPAPAPTGTSSGSSSSPSSTVPAAQELPHANPNEKIDPHGFTAVLDSILMLPYDFANCTFWLSGSSGHQESCDAAGGAYSGGVGGGGAAGAVEGGVEGDVAGSLEGAGVRAAEGDAAAAAGAGAKAVDDAAADMADLVAMKRANAQARAEEADAGAAKPSAPQTGASGTKPSARDSRAPVRKGNTGSKASSAAIVSKSRLPRGTSIEDGLAGARNMRDRVADRELFPNGDGVVASAALAKKTWTAGYNAETGEIAVASSGCGYCAEGNVINALGGDANRVMLTRALFWDREEEIWDEMPICQVCQTYLTPEDVEPGAWYMHPGEWDNR
ncbi:ricin-type beta-trefoil lectin domain protein [Streptomyces sp. A2-16]|uniref:ricin-type beta-trefoil lectin domain protein n=1 Tax=Streptomyces sp. A2-16 TaxID=2781734 RepID=UPI001BAEB13D|nr:ricin-type beta-trefoil lectin domain protein [Streptomyces sp. A2-16]QUC56772.1 ricin-type beta-trefoil lectin domain protein [Streptomyces sp. A2-16]